jgi:PAS domain S-box-containing protein
MGTLGARRQRAKKTLFQRLSELAATSGADSGIMGGTIVQLLAEHFDVPLARIDEIAQERLHCRACYERGHIVSGGSASLRGTPAEIICREKRSYYTTRPLEEFPDDPFLRQQGIRTYAGVPVMNAGGEVQAIVSILSDRSRRLSHRDLELLHIIARWVGAEIERAKLLDAERQRARHASTLLEIVRTINSEIEFKEVLKRIAQATLEAIGADRCNILLFDQQRRYLIPTITISDVGDRELWEKFRRDAVIPIEQVLELQSQLLQQGVVTIDDAGSSPRLPRHLIEQYGVKSVGLALLRSAESEPLGVMILDYYHASHHFSPDEIELLATIAHESAIAITQARLYQRAARASFEWRTTFDAMSDGVFLFDVNGQLKRVNRAGAHLLDRELKSLIGCRADDLLAALGMTDVSVKEIVSLRQRSEQEVAYKDRHLLLSFEPMKDRDEHPTGVVLVARDITERKRREEGERLVQQRTQVLLEMAQACGTVLDIEALLQLIVRKTADFFEADRCSIYLMDDEGERIVRVVNHGADEEVKRVLESLVGREVRTFPVGELLLRSNEPIVVEDARGSELLPRDLVEHVGIRSYVAVPLWDRGHLRAALFIVYGTEEHRFAPEEVSLAGAIAATTAAAISNARLYEMTREAEERYRALYWIAEQHVKQLTALENVTRELTAALDLRHIFESVSDASRAIFDAQRTSIFLTAGEGDRSVCAYASGLSSEFIEAISSPFPWKPDPAAPLQPIYVADATMDASLGHLRPVIEAEGVRSLLVVPLVYGGQPLGTLAFYHTAPRSYTQEEIELAEAFAHQTAIAINNARLYEDLKASEERYIDLYERAPAMYHTMDLNGVILECNQTEAEATGYAKEELIGRSIFDLLPEDSAESLRQRWPELLSEGWVEGLEFQIRKKDGDLLWVACDTRIVNNERGTPLALRAILRDITDRKRLEEQLLRSQRMEAVGTLASGIAHDFNNLLTGVLGFASLAKTLVPPDGELYEYLDMIERSALRASDLTRQILTFARGSRRPRHAVKINDVVEETLELLRRGIASDITIEKRLMEPLPIIEGDSAQIQQALLNLCLNGCEAMPQGGTLTIETRYEFIEDPYVHRVPDAKPGPYVVISVSDTGIGMDQATQARIFDPFFTTKEPGKGTGLGLAIVYGVVHNHEGFINVYSELGHGSTFRVYLPAQRGSEAVAATAHFFPVPGGTETLLVIDDEEPVRRLAQHIFRMLGYRIFEAADGQQGLEIFRQHKDEIDLVILDLTMPRLGGVETYRALKALNPRIKVILSSGYTQEGRAELILREGASAFVQKPYQMQELAQTVRRVLDEK